MSTMQGRILTAAGVDDLSRAAAYSRELTTEELERVLAARNPLVAAALADTRRRAIRGAEATYPVTARVVASGPVPAEPGVFVAHAVDDLDGLGATEIHVIGGLGTDLDSVTTGLRAVRSARPDVPIRALTADDVAALARESGTDLADTAQRLAEAGLSVLSWRAGCELAEATPDVHRALHAAGVATMAILPYRAGEAPADELARLLALRDRVRRGGLWLGAMAVPDTTYAADPLAATSGTHDVRATALLRLAFGTELRTIAVDAHLVGHKQAAMLLESGADDVVGAQAGRDWSIPENDAPRPLNEARVRAYIEECRRIAVPRDGRFVRRVEAIA